jgi:hypothetical protein
LPIGGNSALLFEIIDKERRKKMKRFKLFKIGIFTLASLFIVSTALAGGLPDEWTEINPAGFEYNGLTPACSNAPGTPDCEFTFFVKGGQKNNLTI